MTDLSPAVTDPSTQQVPAEGLLVRYRQELATKTEQLFFAQAVAEAREQEAAQLRLRVAALEEREHAPVADVPELARARR